MKGLNSDGNLSLEHFAFLRAAGCDGHFIETLSFAEKRHEVQNSVGACLVCSFAFDAKADFVCLLSSISKFQAYYSNY